MFPQPVILWVLPELDDDIIWFCFYSGKFGFPPFNSWSFPLWAVGQAFALSIWQSKMDQAHLEICTEMVSKNFNLFHFHSPPPEWFAYQTKIQKQQNCHQINCNNSYCFPILHPVLWIWRGTMRQNKEGRPLSSKAVFLERRPHNSVCQLWGIYQYLVFWAFNWSITYIISPLFFKTVSKNLNVCFQRIKWSNFEITLHPPYHFVMDQLYIYFLFKILSHPKRVVR